MNTLKAPADLLGRILIAVVFVVAGFGKIGGYAGTVGYMESQGVPGILLPLVIAVELAGGLAIIVGYQTRLVALALAGFTLLSGFLFHFDLADQGQSINFMKNLAISGGFLFLFVNGAGHWSLDSWRAGSRQAVGEL